MQSLLILRSVSSEFRATWRSLTVDPRRNKLVPTLLEANNCGAHFNTSVLDAKHWRDAPSTSVISQKLACVSAAIQSASRCEVVCMGFFPALDP